MNVTLPFLLWALLYFIHIERWDFIEREIEAGGQEHFYLETHSNLMHTADILDESPVFHPAMINSETSP